MSSGHGCWTAARNFALAWRNTRPRASLSSRRSSENSHWVEQQRAMPEPSKIGVVMILSRRIWISHLGSLSLFVLGARSVGAQTPSPALLVLEKSANTLAIVDSAT